MKKLSNFFKTLLLIITVIVFCFIGLIVYAVISDYKPEQREIISRTDNPEILADSIKLTFLTWNIGYAGLDKDMDFFYDGGTKVRTPEIKSLENISAICSFLKYNDSSDFIFLQEVDRNSKRSYRKDQFQEISKNLQVYNPFFAKNYDVFFVPTPPSDPMGKVISGIATFSKFTPKSVTRYALPGNMGFPTQLFYLDRCFMVSRYQLSKGKELVIINTHNEAFDKGGIIRKAQMQRLREFITNEYMSGNYVVAGGDWNQNPPDFKPVFSGNREFTGQIGNFYINGIEPDFLPKEWKWIYDPTSPSFRTLTKAYDPATTPTSVCDFFLISPNIELVSVKCHNLSFNNSDHNPVIMQVRIIN